MIDDKRKELHAAAEAAGDGFWPTLTRRLLAADDVLRKTERQIAHDGRRIARFCLWWTAGAALIALVIIIAR